MLKNFLFLRVFKDRTLNIWFRLITLTLLSASLAESDNVSIFATLFIGVIIIIKGRWVIDDFMGLKAASVITRNVVKSYLYIMTLVITILLVYTQLTISV